MTQPSTPPDDQLDVEALRAAVQVALRLVADPCLAAAGITGSIVDLGLVQDLRVGSDGRVEIDLSLTEMGCAFTHHLHDAVGRQVEAVPGVVNVAVIPTWTWRPEQMTPALSATLRDGAASLPRLLAR